MRTLSKLRPIKEQDHSRPESVPRVLGKEDRRKGKMSEKASSLWGRRGEHTASEEDEGSTQLLVFSADSVEQTADLGEALESRKRTEESLAYFTFSIQGRQFA